METAASKTRPADRPRRARPPLGAAIAVLIGALYFLLPLAATFLFSLHGKKDELGFSAYAHVFADPKFYRSFGFSLAMAGLTVAIGLALILPTALLVRLRLPKAQAFMDGLALLPFVVPPVVLAFGLIKLYSSGPLALSASPLLLAAAYVVLVFPYMYRSIDTGLKAIDAKRLFEAAQSLGAGRLRIMATVILPNLRQAVLGAVFLAFAMVMGELTLAVLLAWPAFGPYMAQTGRSLAYEPAALAMVSLALTWAAIMLIDLLTARRKTR